MIYRFVGWTSNVKQYSKWKWKCNKRWNFFLSLSHTSTSLMRFALLLLPPDKNSNKKQSTSQNISVSRLLPTHSFLSILILAVDVFVCHWVVCGYAFKCVVFMENTIFAAHLHNIIYVPQHLFGNHQTTKCVHCTKAPMALVVNCKHIEFSTVHNVSLRLNCSHSYFNFIFFLLRAYIFRSQ